MLVLGIETSCDETACAVVEDGKRILSSCVASSVSIHEKFGGIIPEVASRHHLEFILPVLDESLSKAGIKIENLDLIAVTYGPGLVGSLLIGINLAKALSFSLKKPLIAVNHLAAHLYAPFLTEDEPDLPATGLIVSGGHTELVYIKEFNDTRIIARTRDDAAGEAFDKVAKILNLGYPGGPIIDRRAKIGSRSKIKFKCGRFKNSLDFSFSGIKTAVLYHVKKETVNGKRLTVNEVNDICAGFQDAVVSVLIDNAKAACRLKKTDQLVIGGGVSANSCLREKISSLYETERIKTHLAPPELCLDNASIVAGLGYRLHKLKTPYADFSLEANPVLALNF